MKIFSLLSFGCILLLPFHVKSEPPKIIGRIITPSVNPSKSIVYENHIDLIKDYYLAFQDVDNEKLTSLLADEYRINNLSNIQDTTYSKFTTMSKNLKIRAAALKKAFPDYTLQYGEFLADGNKVVATITLSGTQKGPFLGVAPTNKPIHIKFVDIFTIENGKIIELSQMWNELSVMKQMGYIVF
jgi:steroid delta-isomerase-like uncharacterized protein